MPDTAKILQHVRDIGVPDFHGILGGALTDYFSWNIFDSNGPAVPTTTYATTALTNLAIDYIHNAETARPNEPWFIYQAYNAPHAANGGNSPYQVPPAELHHVDLSSVGNPKPGTSATNVPVYKADIQALDTELGRLLKEVDLEKTTVIFLGDNGTPAEVKDKGSKIRGSKGSAYEGGVRVPFFVTGAGVTRRGRANDLVVTTDIYATVLSLTGIDVSHVNNSYSIKPVLSDATATSGRTHSFSETSSGTSQPPLRHQRHALQDRLQPRQAGAIRSARRSAGNDRPVLEAGICSRARQPRSRNRDTERRRATRLLPVRGDCMLNAVPVVRDGGGPRPRLANLESETCECETG